VGGGTAKRLPFERNIGWDDLVEDRDVVGELELQCVGVDLVDLLDLADAKELLV
jgi:hypothetical protein